MMAIDNNVLSNFNLELMANYGRLPNSDNEICISENLYNTIVYRYEQINSFEDLQDVSMYINGDNYKIVGVIRDGTDLSKYADLDGTDYSNNYKKYEKLNKLMKYGFANMCYITETKHEELSSRLGNFYNNRYEPYVKGEDTYYGTSVELAKNFKGYSYNYVYLKDGVTLETLTGNQAIVTRSLISNLLKIEDADLEAKFNEGITINFGAGYEPEKKHIFSVNVVGIIDTHNQQVLVSDELYKEYYTGADYIISSLKQNSNDRSLIRSIENYNKTNFTFKVQCSATDTLDMFGSFISGAAKIFLYIGIGLAVFAGFMLMNFISTSISYKKREIGVLRAIGARGKDVFSIFFSESFIICMINFVLSWISCSITCSLINKGMNNAGVELVLMMFGSQQVALLFGISLLVAFVASFFPVFKCARKNPIDSINNR